MSILICYDGSPSAQRSLSIAADTLGGSAAVLLNVWNPPDRVVADSFGFDERPGGPTYEELEEFEQHRAADVLAQGQGRAARLGVSVTTRAERNRSTVWKTIIDVADQLDAELIVTGTYGHTAVESGLLGSVSNALVHNSRRPVLVVPAGKPT